MSEDEIEHWIFIRRITAIMFDAHERGDYRLRDKAVQWLEILTMQHLRMMDRTDIVSGKAN